MKGQDNNQKVAVQVLDRHAPEKNTNSQPHSSSTAGCCAGSPTHEEDDHHHDHGISYIPTIASLLLLLGGIGMDYFGTSWFEGLIRFAWYLAAYLPVGGKVLAYAAQNIAKGDVFNEFFLMGIATLGAFFIGEYAEGVAVMLFYVIGEHFQESAVDRSRKSIKALIDNRPDTVNVLRNGSFEETHPSSVKIGQTIQAKAGEKIPLDGKMLSDSSYFNTDALTGESTPRTIRKGETILAGMVNLENVIEIKVTAAYENSTLSKVLKLVEQASGRKAKTQRFITRFAKIYTPIVVFLAVALTLVPFLFVAEYIFEDWLYRALVFLVISCPCALVISIPLGYFGGIGAASKNGILFKGSNFLDLITQVDTVVLDKTGTLTKGVFEVQEVKVLENSRFTRESLLSITAALESQSTHPIARALTEYRGKSTDFHQVSDVKEISGHGLKGTVDGMSVLVGNGSLLKKFNIPYPLSLDHEINSLVIVAIENEYVGHITISDKVKDDALETVQKLQREGIGDIILLSGDKTSITVDLADKLGINQAFGDLLPQDKMTKVEELKNEGKTILFAGDGINDAPVITLADVGIAMGGLGSDAAIETADVVIQDDRPSKIATAIRIGKRTKQIVWQNIGMAFGVKAVVLAFGAFGVASLWEAVFADVGVALLAILNAVRIQKMKFK